MKKICLILFLLTFGLSCFSNDSIFRVCFYNFENLFDTFDDPNKNDDDFTPRGIKGWSSKKFKNKLNNLYKLVIALNCENPAAVIGICEVENKFVLDKLLNDTPLKKLAYSYIHYESNDPRGIDVALLYRPDIIEFNRHKAIPVIMPGDTVARTRDILYAVGKITDEELHFFVCHFPSRYGGVGATVEKRNFVASFLRSKVDSILEFDPTAKIILMGDFNDDPDDVSIKTHLCGDKLINLMDELSRKSEIGTLKHGAVWSFFDQIIVTQNLLQSEDNRLYIKDSKAQIANFDFLFMDDLKFGGKKLFRTFNGAQYLGGFSDHLPVFVELRMEN
ncbi:hypothetical protein LJC25_01285 [Bacteroidales bacterium OttesenSCG-928-K03]|nr:hypothetical protein [Odoribacter sp. OttesenSCG-928-L07]MDL2239228.1 endonuclease [Bacteroidales bacterium OttesenSCG-928-L14]MDL2240058.1 endonuclease [Bacteroidales bacterium OttesenSCG-928-K22]MDL2242339.1 hypothetical protein [Bacteroidales bacterium OttesenSCG-928-K03]